MANPNVAKYKEESKSYRAQQMVTRVLAYIFLVFVTFLSLFSFYLLIINGSRSNAELQAGFTLIPSTHFGDNLSLLSLITLCSRFLAVFGIASLLLRPALS